MKQCRSVTRRMRVAGVPALTLLALLARMVSPAHAAEWGPETNISGTATDSETGLNHRPIVALADGTVHVVWAERDGPNSTYRVWTRQFTTSGWSSPERIVDYLATDPGNAGDDIGAKYPALAATPNGDVHLFWHDYRIAGIDNVEIFWKMRPAGGAWDASRAADVRLTTSLHPEVSGENAYVPVPVAMPDGSVHVTWYDYRFEGWNAEILSKRRPAGGVWDLTPGDSADERVTNEADHSELVDTASDAAGNVHAVWRSLEGGARIRHSVRDAVTGTWSPPVLVDLAGNVAGAPTAAVDASGTLHVIWPDSRAGGRALFTRVRTASGTWSVTDTRITRPAEGADEPSLAVGDTGTLHLAFSDGRLSLLNREIFHRELAGGGAWDTTGTSDARLSNAAGSSTRPSVAARNGDVFVMWKDARDGNHEIYFRARSTAGTGVNPVARIGAPTLIVAPNPARGAMVRLSRPDRTPIGRVLILDAAGRRIGQLPAGDEDIEWDLRNLRGQRVGPGVYFFRATTGENARVTVLR